MPVSHGNLPAEPDDSPADLRSPPAGHVLPRGPSASAAGQVDEGHIKPGIIHPYLIVNIEVEVGMYVT